MMIPFISLFEKIVTSSFQQQCAILEQLKNSDKVCTINLLLQFSKHSPSYTGQLPLYTKHVEFLKMNAVETSNGRVGAMYFLEIVQAIKEQGYSKPLIHLASDVNVVDVVLFFDILNNRIKHLDSLQLGILSNMMGLAQPLPPSRSIIIGANKNLSLFYLQGIPQTEFKLVKSRKLVYHIKKFVKQNYALATLIHKKQYGIKQLYFVQVRASDTCKVLYVDDKIVDVYNES